MMRKLVYSSSSSLVTSLRYSPRGTIRASRDHVRVKTRKSRLPSGSSSTSLCSCGRKHFLEAPTPAMPISSPNASRTKEDDSKAYHHPQRPDWYKELFAFFLSKCLGSYEAEIADYKRKLFKNLAGKAEKVLEIGVGTGPNLKYFASNENVCVFGMDPNLKMEKYACKSAREAGMKPENFKFIEGVGEAIPLDDDSVDAVVATLVLCSVSDVAQTLNEIKRVLKPGGIYLFIEHVAAEDGSVFRHVQNVLDPLQQLVVDGCHLTRNTGLYISEAGFNGGTEINNTTISSFPWIIRPHVYGVAYK